MPSGASAERPLFADLDLVAEIEAAERDLVRDCTLAAFAQTPALGEAGFCEGIAGGVATFTRDDSPLNKVAGLGFAGAVDPAALATIERAYAERGAATLVELSSLADPSVAALLGARGYVVVGFENVLGLPLDRTGRPDSAPAPEIRVRESPPEEYEVWLDVLVSGFIQPAEGDPEAHEALRRESLLPVLRDMAQAEGFHRVLALRGEALAGAASLRLDRARRLVQLSGAATLPAHRRRGVQGSLLRARLDFARAAGSKLALVTTQPGSTSQHNVQRQGFALLYTRAIFSKPAPPQGPPRGPQE